MYQSEKINRLFGFLMLDWRLKNEKIREIRRQKIFILVNLTVAYIRRRLKMWCWWLYINIGVLERIILWMCKEMLKKYSFLVCYNTNYYYNNIAMIVKSEQKKMHTYIPYVHILQYIGYTCRDYRWISVTQKIWVVKMILFSGRVRYKLFGNRYDD